MLLRGFTDKILYMDSSEVLISDLSGGELTQEVVNQVSHLLPKGYQAKVEEVVADEPI